MTMPPVSTPPPNRRSAPILKARDAGKDREREFYAPEVAFLAGAQNSERGVREKLELAARIAKTQGVTVDRALLGERIMREETFYRAYAHHVGAPFVTEQAQFFKGLDLTMASQAGVAPIHKGKEGRDWLYAPRGRTLAAVAAFADTSRIAITSPRRFDTMLRAAHSEQIAEQAAASVNKIEPRLSAAAGPGRRTLRLCATAAATFLALAGLDLGMAWRLICFAALSGFIASTLVRLLITTVAAGDEPRPKPLTQRQLPYYTVIIALYHEDAIAPNLVRALEALDYPRSKLDVKFVVESDDAQTARALARAITGVEYEIIVAPPGALRTKPRALNVALPFARGELAAVYDAEDSPEPDQLRKAAGIFANSSAQLACLQARLVVDNAQENWLTACFAIDYATLFEWTNPGLAALDLPIALGGTSNHFRVDVLRALGGWDAWNVTEDADLGVRLARCGLKVKTFQSSTFEEAPARLGAFMRQRTRWMKGRIQTAFVHSRDLPALWRNLGPRRFLAGFGVLFADLFGPLLWPFFFVSMLVDIHCGKFLDFVAPHEWLMAAMSLWLIVFGAWAMAWPTVSAMRRAKRLWLLKYVVFWPVWFVLLWIAAWRAVFEIIHKPFYWAKTEHGVSKKRVKPPHA